MLRDLRSCLWCAVVTYVTSTWRGSSHGKLSYNYVKPAQALIPAVLMNVGIVGLNQVYDKKIDMVSTFMVRTILNWFKLSQVNKSYLPLASGEFSSSSALLVVSLSVTCSLVLGMLLQTLRAHLRAHSVFLRRSIKIKCTHFYPNREVRRGCTNVILALTFITAYFLVFCILLTGGYYAGRYWSLANISFVSEFV